MDKVSPTLWQSLGCHIFFARAAAHRTDEPQGELYRCIDEENILRQTEREPPPRPRRRVEPFILFLLLLSRVSDTFAFGASRWGCRRASTTSFRIYHLNRLWSGCFNRFFIAATTMAVPILQRRATGAVAALCVYFRSLLRRASSTLRI